MSDGENLSLLPTAVSEGNTDTYDAAAWRQPNASILFDARTFSSLDEMKGSLLEAYCPGDGVLSGALSLITTAATPSMLSIPLAFVVGGWAYAACCMAACIVVTFLSVRILTLASISADSDDYVTVAGFFFGPKGYYTVQAVMFFYNFGCTVVYLSFIKVSITPILLGRATYLPQWLRGNYGGSLFLIASIVVIAPLTFNSRLASLRTKGFISNLFTIFIIFAIAYRYLFPMDSTATGGRTLQTESPLDIHGPFTNPTIVGLLPYTFVAPIFVFSYEVQSNVMAVIKDLHDKTGHKILVSIMLALSVITAFYVLLGVFGSLTFPNLSAGNILSVYDVQVDTLMMVCQLLCCFSAAISFVFCIFPSRLALFMFLTGGKEAKINRSMRTKLGVGLSAMSCFLALFLPDVAKAVSILGAVFSSTLSMSVPALLGLKMRHSGTYLTSYLDVILLYALLAAGVGFSLVGTLMAVVFMFAV